MAVSRALTASTLIGAQRISISAHFNSVLLVEDVPDLLEDAAVAGLPHFLTTGGGELVQRLALALVQPRRRGHARDDVLVAADGASHLGDALAGEAEDVAGLRALGK